MLKDGDDDLTSEAERPAQQFECHRSVAHGNTVPDPNIAAIRRSTPERRARCLLTIDGRAFPPDASLQIALGPNV